jgi:hypothetical protein
MSWFGVEAQRLLLHVFAGQTYARNCLTTSDQMTAEHKSHQLIALWALLDLSWSSCCSSCEQADAAAFHGLTIALNGAQAQV